MVGYDPKKKLSELDFMFAGSASGVITRLLCQPLDVLKIRFQLQVEPIERNVILNSKYRTIIQATKLIFREEGAKALWKGHVPGQLLSISYGLAQFTTFEVLTKESAKLGITKKWDIIVHFMCGLVSGCTATFVSFPFDVVRTRLVAQSEGNKIYKGVPNAFYQIVKQEGPLVLYRGMLPTFMQVGPHAGAQFMFYKIFDNLYKNTVDSDKTTLASSTVSGSLAGFFAKIVVYPFDLIKKRLQIQGFNRGDMFGENFVCNGMINCMSRIYEREGYRGYFKGLNASLLKAVATSALYFSSYEMVCEAIQVYRTA
ncbi:mitochondrial thiamine pyrophosphate carrier [Coccinella septempunctata]|uniref:mitochondrial thiamine pyrophosphate carrier n=1 Tax=Coccinella septempunctata TaxID=41139 RepID=UPI001D096DDF|nr:mitochondrial thiamine pyrophosphate carrier [Coccinella septempunctata]